MSEREDAIHQEIARRLQANCTCSLMASRPLRDWCTACLLRAVSSGPSPGVWEQLSGEERALVNNALLKAQEGANHASLIFARSSRAIDYLADAEAYRALRFKLLAAPTGEASLPEKASEE